MSSKPVVHSQRLHRNVVDAEVVTALKRRERKGDDSLQLTVALSIQTPIITYLVLEAIDPLDFAIMEIAIPLLTIPFKEKVFSILTT